MSHGGLGIEHLIDVEPIGLGGRDDLFTATDLKLDRRVALRRLPPVREAQERDRFLDEARVLAAVAGHPNVIRVYDVGIDVDERPYLVMELPDGPDLAEHLERRGPLPWPEAVDVAIQLAAGLAQFHEVDRLHDDLRPANVFLTGSTVELSDIGLVGASSSASDDPATLVHRAPETMAAGDADQRSDLYSLTSILHQLIDGQPAHWRPDDTALALRARIGSQPPPPLDPDMAPAALRVFVTAGLSVDPIDRPQNATEFSRELELIREGRVTGSTPSVLHATSAHTIERPLPSTGSFHATRSTATSDLGPEHWPPPGPAGANPATAVMATVAPASGQAVAPASGQAVAPASGQAVAPAAGPAFGAQPGSVAAPPLGSIPTEVSVPALPPEVGYDPAGPVGYDPAGPTSFDPEGPAGYEGTAGHGHGFEPDATVGPDAVRPRTAPDRSQLLVAAGAMVTVGLIGLAAVLAMVLSGSGSDGEAAAPLLPGSETAAVDGDPSDSGGATGLAPLAMLQESTTTTVSPDVDASITTTIQRAIVPDLVGLDIEVAGQQLADAGFEVLVVGRVSPGSAPGTVIQQTPAAGASVILPTSVTLFIPRPSTLPAMVGRPADTVCRELATLGVQCRRVLQFDDGTPAGIVVATDPAQGSSYEEGTTVRLQVSRGPQVKTAIPQVAGMREQAAREALSNAGFVSVLVAPTPSESVEAGRAIGTEPAAGTELPIDQPVTIMISSGPAPQVTVPEVVGMTQAAAESALASAELTASIATRELPAGDSGIGMVLASDPSPGAEVLAGSSVALTVGAEAASSTTTTTAPSTTSTSSGG